MTNSVLTVLLICALSASLGVAVVVKNLTNAQRIYTRSTVKKSKPKQEQ